MARNRSVVLTLGLLVLPLLGIVTEGRGADVLIVERPARLVLLDRYQQSMPAQERNRLPAFVPMVIRNQDARLGDGVTACVVVEVEGGLLYLVREEGGELAGRQAAGSVRWLRDVRLLADTVELLISLPAHSPDRKVLRNLQRGEKLALIFESGRDVYARRPAGGYVWVTPRPSGTAWRVLRSGVVKAVAAEGREVVLIRSALDATNQAFASLFEYYNRSTGNNRPVPRWELEVRDAGFACVLHNSPDPMRFAASTELLARELQTLLLGRAMKVAVTPGSIDIFDLERAQETR